MTATLSTLCAILGMAVLSVLPASPSALQQPAPERFTALAVNMGSPWPSGAATVEIDVERWSTDSERQHLLISLRERGPQTLLDELQKLPRVGYIRTPNSVGYDLHFAQRLPDGDGGERVVIATDRYIGFWEAANQPRTIDYPFTVIDMRLGSNGEGQGKMSIAAKISVAADGKTIELEDFATQPVRLTAIRRREP